MKIKGVVFDFNGLILDTETPGIKTRESLYQEFRIPFPIKENKNNIGALFDDNSIIRYLMENLGSSKTPQSKFQG